MFHNKKIIILIISVLLVLVFMFFVLLIVAKNRDNSPKVVEEPPTTAVSDEELEANFKNMFYNISYQENTEDGLVEFAFDFNQKEENKYDIKAFVPKIIIETETTKKINEEIVNIFGGKIVEIGKKEEGFALYTVDYLTLKNNEILSLIIKGTIKEGSNPQRVFFKTYNYDIKNDKVLTIEEVIKEKNLDKDEIQSKILEVIRQKNTSAKNLAEQGYNVYVRDIRSDEYLLENIDNFFIGEDENLYIVFSYGNNTDTETYDMVIIHD